MFGLAHHRIEWNASVPIHLVVLGRECGVVASGGLCSQLATVTCEWNLLQHRVQSLCVNAKDTFRDAEDRSLCVNWYFRNHFAVMTAISAIFLRIKPFQSQWEYDASGNYDLCCGGICSRAIGRLFGAWFSPNPLPSFLLLLYKYNYFLYRRIIGRKAITTGQW